MDELKTFTNRMAELGDLDTSELIRLNQDKTKEAGTFLSKLEVSFAMSWHRNILDLSTHLIVCLH